MVPELIYRILGAVLVTAVFAVNAAIEEKELPMTTSGTASGSFEIALEPQQDTEAPAGRMIIRKSYSGGLVGSGIGQMISKRTSGGAAAYSAVEEFSGSLAGKQGAFTLIHSGFMSAEEQRLDIYVLPGSGTDELANISGTLEIVQKDGIHSYILHYQL